MPHVIMNHFITVRGACALLLLAAGIGSPLGSTSALAQVGPGAQSVLERLTRGESARQAISVLAGSHSSAGTSLGRGADAIQLDVARERLMDALIKVEAGAPATSLTAAFEAWRAAADIVRLKFEEEGGRLAASPDGAAYVARHEQVRGRVQAGFDDVQRALEPLIASGAALPQSRVRSSAADARRLLSEQPGRPAESPILRARAVPFGGLELSPRQPVLTPVVVPTYRTQNNVTPVGEDRASTAQAPLTPEIIVKAKSLDNDYVRIYEYVRNNVRNEWYAGAVKGAVGVLRSGAGNDVDQASLLTALLRSAGLDTRYVQGAVEVPVERIASELGLPAAESHLVPAALTKGGVAFAPVVKGGRIAAVTLGRTWVSAYVPYTNYRGALVDGSGRSWIPLDPFHKTVAVQASPGVFGRSFSAASLSGEFLSTTQREDFGAFLRHKVDAALIRSGTPGGWQAQRRVSVVEPLQLDILPNSLPYSVTAVTRESADLASADVGTVRVRLHQGAGSGDALVLDKTLPLSAVANARLTLSYGPASVQDHRVALIYGGMDSVPLYLIGLRGQLKLGGEMVAAATERVEPGAPLHLSLEIQGPWGTQEVVQTVTAGAYHAFIVANDPQRPAVAAASDGELLGAKLLDGLGVFYARQWNEADRDVSSWLDVGVVRPVPAVTIASTTLRPVLVAGEPITLEWTGVSLDAALRPVDAAGAKAQEFLSLSALAGSSLESAVFREQFAVEAISADRGLQLANERGQTVLDITAANAAALDATDHSPGVKTAVRDLVRQGYAVRMPKTRLTVNAWTGSVWQAARDGHAGFFLSGGLAGGETVVPPDQWPLSFLADAFGAMTTEESSNDPLSGARLERIGVSEGLEAKPGETIAKPLMVRVTDKHGRGVRGAAVRFSVLNGDGRLGEGREITVATNALGIASTSLTAGTDTSLNSAWTHRGGEHPTRIGYIDVTATVPSSLGQLQVDRPFEAVLLPGAFADVKPVTTPLTRGLPSTTAEILSLTAVDKHGNPVPNVDVNLSITSTSVCRADGPPGGFKGGALWDGTVGADGCKSAAYLGQCGSPTLALRSRSDGRVHVGIILSNEPTSTNRVDLSAPGVSKQFNYETSGTCRSSFPDAAYVGMAVVTGGEAASDGSLLTAVGPGEEYPQPFKVSFHATEYPHYLDAEGNLRFQPYVNIIPATGVLRSATITAGGTATLSGTSIRLRAGLTPLNYTTQVKGSVTFTAVRAKSGGGKETFSNTADLDFTGPSLWAVKPTVTSILSVGVPSDADPTKIYLDSVGRSLYPLQIEYKVEPAEYKARERTVLAVVRRDGSDYTFATGETGTLSGKALLPHALAFQPLAHLYDVQMGIPAAFVPIKGPAMPLPLRQKLLFGIEAKGAFSEVDVANQRACARPGVLTFSLAQVAKVRATYQHIGSGVPLGEPIELEPERVYEIGQHAIQLDAARLGSGLFRLVVAAQAVADESMADRAEVNVDIGSRLVNALPVGQVLIHGVNVRNGILTHQTGRVSVPGRGAPFEFLASYSSAAAGAVSTVGANWAHNHDLSLAVNSCGEVSLSAGDSGSVRFFPKADGTMVPDRGYHGTLIPDRSDNSWDFYSKDGTHYHYAFVNQRVQWRVTEITDRNGNTQTYSYDNNASPDPLLSKVERSDGRHLIFTYKPFNVEKPLGKGAQMSLLTRVDANGDNVVELDYDELGNLKSHKVNGRETKYTYSTDQVVWADRYRLKTATDAKGNQTRYDYLVAPLNVQAERGTIALDHLTVRRVDTPLGGSMTLTIDTAKWQSSEVLADPGSTTRYAFNQHGNPLSIADAVGTTTMTWSPVDAVLETKTDARGVLTTYVHDTHGNLREETVDGASTRLDYEVMTAPPYSKSRLKSRTDRNGHETVFSLDTRGNVRFERHPIGTVEHTYLGNGDRSTTTDANGKVTRFGHDTWGNLESVTNPEGETTRTPRDKRGRVDYTEDARGYVTDHEYDEQDNLIWLRNAKGHKRLYGHDALGNKTSEVDEAGRRTGWTIGKVSLVDAMEFDGDGISARRVFTYDGAGNKKTESDWNGNVTTFTYDDVLRLETRSEPLGKTTTFKYDAVGNLKREETLDRVVLHDYDALGRREQTTDAEGKVWKYRYDFNGNRKTSEDPLNRVTTYAYDAMNRLKAVHEPLGRSTTYDYFDNGNKKRETDSNGHATEFEYDGANRLRKRIHPNGYTVLHDYDRAGNLERVTNEAGYVTLYTYDELNRKQTAKDPGGFVTTYGYDPVGNLKSEDWPNGNVVRHTYDGMNRRTSTTDSFGSVGSWLHDPMGNLKEEFDGEGNKTSHDYNALNYRKSSTLPGARNIVYTPNLFGNVEEVRDARGHTTLHRYDKLGRLRRTTNPDGGVVVIDFDDAGNKTSVTNARGHATVTKFNALNRAEHITDAEGKTASYTYDFVGNLKTETDRRGTLTEFTYDEMNRLELTRKAGIDLELLTYTPTGKVETRKDASGHVTTYTYDRRSLLRVTNAPEGVTTLSTPDSMGDPVELTDGEGRVTVSKNDHRRRQESVTNPAGETTRFGYDLNNNRTEVIRPKGERAVYTFDERNWLTRVTEPLARVSLYERDNNGNLTKFTDPENRWIRFDHDVMNRRRLIEYSTGDKQTFKFDFDGNLQEHVDANAIVAVRTFDRLNREKTRSFSASNDGLTGIDTTYDDNGNVLTVAQKFATGNRTVMKTYDRFDREATVDDGFGGRIEFGYYPTGNRRSLLTQDGKLTQYTYDKLNRLATLSSPAGTEIYTYDLSGLMREQLNSNGTKTVTTYDAASRPKRITLSKGSVPLNLTEYRYDPNGNREEERINRPTGAQVTTYGYDAADRLKWTRRVEGANTVATEWTYDLADNRLTETVASTGEGAGTVSRVYRYDERNQLRGITDSALGATTLDYDPQGNLKQKARGSDTTTFEWSARDLLVSVSRNGTLLGRYGSDHAGLRVHKEAADPQQPGAPARVLRTQWDDQNAVQDRDASGSVVARYDFAGGQPVAMWSATDAAQVLHADALGSVVATTATDGTVKSETLYDAWGTPLLKTGSSANKFAYTGHQADAETGLYYFKARYYDPETGRFISVDPAEGQDARPASYHKYLYAYANPLSYTDPAGTQAVSPLPFPFNLLALAVPTEESRKRNDELGLRIQGWFRDKWEAVFSDNASVQPSSAPWVPSRYPDTVSGAQTEMESLIRDRNRAWASTDRNEWDRALLVVQSRINLLEGKFGKAAFEGMDVRFPSPWTPNSGPQIGTTVEGKPGEPTEVRSLSGKPINQPDAQRSRVPGTTAHSPDRGDNVLGLPRVDPAATVILMSEGNSPSTNKGGTATKGIGTESANAARALSSKLSALEDAQATAAKVHTLPDGRIRYYEAERAARTAGPSRGSSYVTEWNPANGNVRSWNEVYDQAGNVNRVHPKMINGQTVDSLHYPPTARELGR